MDDEKIDNLWRWFYMNAQRIIYCIDNEIVDQRQEIVGNIDNLVLDLGRFSWEISPGTNKLWSFTISPNGDKKLLEQTREIIKNAPELDDWEFNYCKPAKNGEYKFVLYDENMFEQNIDARAWKFVAKQQNSQMFEIIIEAKNIAHLDSETALRAANIVVLNEIGEETKIKYVANVQIVDEILIKDTSKKKLIPELRNQFD